ncbi:MAG: VOC family protein [Alphaproteobacteria bacterium]|nr:VOC family protein [Alphaproteobacteria bacterium]
MKLKLHHMNFATEKVGEMDEFYRGILDMESEAALGDGRIKEQGYGGDVAFVSDGDIQIHIAEKDMKIGFKTGQAVNPVDRGHIAFRTDDIASFKKRLEEKGIPYSNFGAWAMKGWEQIFFYDPDGNVVEVHQVHE